MSALVVTFSLAVIYFPVSSDPITGELTRPVAAIPLALYGLYLFIQYEDVGDAAIDRVREGVDIRREWGNLAAGLLVIGVAVERLVGSVESLEATFGNGLLGSNVATGVVTTITGITHCEATIAGEANHAGATAMGDRTDESRGDAIGVDFLVTTPRATNGRRVTTDEPSGRVVAV